MKQVSLITLFLCLIVKVFAQEESRTFKNDIGFNTTFILNGILNTGTAPFSVIYKAYTKDHQALRLGLATRLNLNEVKSDLNDSISSQNLGSFNLSLTLGKEFQQSLNKKWIWYYGGDLIPGYSYAKDSRSGSNILSKDEYKTETYSLAIKPFLAIRFNIHERLYLSTEASLSIGYNKASTTFTNSRFNPDTDQKAFSIALNPAAGLFLNYRF